MAEMTPEEAYAFLDNGPRYAVLSTVGKDGFPHAVPLGYFRVGDEVVLSMRGQHKVNAARNPKVSVLLEDGDSMTNLRGLLVRGEAVLVEDAEGVLELTRGIARRRGTAEDKLPTEPRPGAAFARIPLARFASWDNTKDQR